MDQGFIVIFIIIIAIGIGIFAFYANMKRRQEWQQFANNHGFSYERYDSIGLPEKYSDYQLFKQGHSKKGYNLCLGKDKDLNICTFDYQYTTGSGKNQQTHFCTGIMAESSLIFKPLYIRPENILDKIGAAIGFDDIDFESAEFSKKFYVKCEDKKFAYDIIHARMIDFLLQCQKICIETRFQSVLFHRDRRLSISEMELLLIEAEKFIELTPDYVRQEISLPAGKV